MLWVLYLVICLFVFLFSPGISFALNWDQLRLLVLLKFLFFYEFTWNSYLLQSWRVALCVCPYTDCMCLLPLVGELDLTSEQVTSFLRGTLAALTLAEGGAVDGGAWVGATCKLKLPVCSVPITVVSGTGIDPQLLKQKPWGLTPS